MQISFSPPDISEEEVKETIDTLKSGWITTGPKTKLFEKKIAEYCGTEKAVCLNSATACLEGILRALGIGEGDEVITSAYTYTATASPIYHVGAKIVLVDTELGSYEMDYKQVSEAITEKTKAIIAIDLGGVVCNYSKIFEIVEEKKYLFSPANELQNAIGRITVIADAAHALGARRYEKVCGNIADFTSFSFHAVKNLTTAEGGALTWRKIEGINDEYLYKKFMLFSLHGQSKDALEKTRLGAWEYDIVSLAYKCNMTDIMAGIGLSQLKRYPEMLKKRRNIIEKYDNTFIPLGNHVLSHYNKESTSSGHLYLMRIPGICEKKRNEIIFKLAEQKISTNVHYKPLPMMTAYKKLGYQMKNFPNAYKQYINEITLPLHTLLNDEEVEYICKCVGNLLKEVKK